MNARYIQEIGTRAWLRVYWGHDCQYKGYQTFHNAKIFLIDGEKDNWDLGGRPEDYPNEMWPTKCETCGAIASPDATHQVFHTRLYNTASGDPEPGDLYYADWYPKNFYWDNQPEAHLFAVLPNGYLWDIDSRASNCTMKEDRNHRCWVRHGEPPFITVGKTGGRTCAAGAGSIAAPGWHGFLRNGKFEGC